jgi:hypothetical protein
MLIISRLWGIYPERKTELLRCEIKRVIIEIAAIVKTGTGKIRTICL